MSLDKNLYNNTAVEENDKYMLEVRHMISQEVRRTLRRRTRTCWRLCTRPWQYRPRHLRLR